MRHLVLGIGYQRDEDKATRSLQKKGAVLAPKCMGI